MTFPRFISLVILSLYLLLPVQSIASAITALDSADHAFAQKSASSEQLPCHDCPCSAADHSDCDATCSCCLMLFPSLANLACRYNPAVLQLTAVEPYWILPHVYLSIYVPPQNQA